MRTKASLILFLLLTVPTYAADKQGKFATWGKGSKSCHHYNTARNTDEEQRFKDYLMGYLTAYNVYVPETYRISGSLDLGGIMDWLDEYCESKPMVSFEQSLADFAVEHFDKRMRRPPTRR